MDREEKAGRDLIQRRITMLEQPIQQKMRRIITGVCLITQASTMVKRLLKK